MSLKETPANSTVCSINTAVALKSITDCKINLPGGNGQWHSQSTPNSIPNKNIYIYITIQQLHINQGISI